MKIANSLEELLKNCQTLHIDVKEDKYFPLLNLCYSQTMSPKFDSFVQKCRGLVVDKETLEIVAHPFNRFFNYGEGKEQLSYDLKNLTYYEKVDGSLIKIYWYKTKWLIGTKGQAVCSNKNFENFSFYDLVLEALNLKNDEEFQQWCFEEKLDKELTYLFEITSKHNCVVVPHSKTELWFLATVSKQGEVIQNPYDLDFSKTSHSLLIKKPKQYNFEDIDEASIFSKNLPFNDEGYVIYSNKQPVFKIKSPAYVQIHLMSDKNALYNEKPAIKLVYLGEVAEYLTYFPTEKDKFLAYDNAKNAMVEDMIKSFLEVRNSDLDQKSFAESIKNHPYKHVLFHLRRLDQQKNIEDLVSAVNYYLTNILSDDFKINILTDYMNRNNIKRPLAL